MHAASRHDLALGIVLLTQRISPDDGLSRHVRAWFASPIGTLRNALAEGGKLPEEEIAAAEQVAAKWLELGNLPSSADEDNPFKSSMALGGAEPSLPLFDDLPNEEEPVESRQQCCESLPPAARYRIVRRHAGGGLGEIFLAHDEELGRDVALKRIREEYVAHSDLRARFMLEAEITGLVEHPGVVPVYGRGHDKEGCPFYAMRFIQGRTLQQAIDEYHRTPSQPGGASDTGLELRRLLRHFVDVCNAVACVHHRGVIHRDLKPENVMIGPYGETFVLDWGLAKIVGRSENEAIQAGSDSAGDMLCDTLRPLSANSPMATQIGAAMGTLAYMSPEQAAGLVDQLRPASDLYCAGCDPICHPHGTRTHARHRPRTDPPERLAESVSPTARNPTCRPVTARGGLFESVGPGSPATLSVGQRNRQGDRGLDGRRAGAGMARTMADPRSTLGKEEPCVGR